MSATKQVVISGDLNAQTYSATVWDLVTGTTLKTFRNGGVLASKCLSLVSDQFLMAVQKDTAIIHYWALNGKQQQKKIICPAKVNVLTVTPDGHFAIVGIKEQLFIYQLSTGNLLTKLERHFQPITCIKVAGDSSYFISGGEDGYVFVWFTHEILSNTSFSHGSSNDSSLAGKEPKHSWSYHSAQITDIYCAYSRINGKCATCSIDQTCKVNNESALSHFHFFQK
ncbi:WD repeat-containing protein 18-like protein [Dinothrombium tinctorium]|uniref:WD repeat-containing protein 18-like protein n=1 Tax=Dinothrombium tinctorium TaxID=1965070 RepID=A0A3S3P1X1_9ACAR|nr:WD repeat-containing protein 18-like protein [Dinothrombium tinctorium]